MIVQALKRWGGAANCIVMVGEINDLESEKATEIQQITNLNTFEFTSKASKAAIFDRAPTYVFLGFFNYRA